MSAHAILRAKQRYDLDLHAGHMAAIACMIQQNQGRLIGHLERGLTVWKLLYKKRWLRVVMDPTFYEVVTFLPSNGPITLRDGKQGKMRVRP